MILNFGCGRFPIEGAINIDVFNYPEVDKIMDFSKFPYPFEDNSVDGIYMLHFLEHMKDDCEVIKECYRILKPGGFLFIAVPHSSRCSSIGTIGHYRTYSVDTMPDYYCNENYIFSKKMFKTVMSRINYMFFPYNNRHPYIKFKYPRQTVNQGMSRITYWLVLRPVASVIQVFINLSPRVFEYFWCYWVGGASEVMWKGEKI